MQLFFVADGPRDLATIPEIVTGILNVPSTVEFHSWKGLRIRGGGYKRKLRFALLQARDRGVDGVVATVDSDNAKPKERLSMLRAARDEDRRNPSAAPIPAAVGEAVPHVEAWLLDDPKAVRDVLRLPTDKSIPSVRQSDSKTELNALIAECERKSPSICSLKSLAISISSAVITPQKLGSTNSLTMSAQNLGLLYQPLHEKCGVFRIETGGPPVNSRFRDEQRASNFCSRISPDRLSALA